MPHGSAVRPTIATVLIAALVASCGDRFSDGSPGAADAVQEGGITQSLVVFMDSRHPARVYDEETVLSGQTNADLLTDLLSDLPIQGISETIGPNWSRDRAIVEMDPDLVVIHYSGFREEDGTGPRERLREFIRHFGDSDTQFVIYSRTREGALSDTVRDLLAGVGAEHPTLLSRVQVFGLDDHGPRSWRSPATTEALRQRVRELLGR